MKIRVLDDLNPEDLAMLQALYSRSAESVDAHLDKAKAGSGKFMSQYYVNYGHKSIADCGSTTIFFEGVSLLAAKAIQDWPLYSGQETSTRYIDMSKQPIIDPIGTPESRQVLMRWMNFYSSNQDRVAETIRARYPKRPDEKQETYDRAVKARTFDVLRGFLPAGITTQLSWHTNLRQAADHLGWLRYHPVVEIAEIARFTTGELATKYQSSGFDRAMAGVSGERVNVGQHDWMLASAYRWTYPTYAWEDLGRGSVIMHPRRARGMSVGLAAYDELLISRPRGCVLPHFLSDLGQLSFDFRLDFGSFRDLQRHRNGVCRMPRLTTMLGFNSWYLGQLDDDLRAEAVRLIDEQTYAIYRLDSLGGTNEAQYFVALGFNVACQVTYALPALVYMLELRSSKTVHPTLRRVVHNMIRVFRDSEIGGYVNLHVDMDPDDWDVRRGDQTITERKP